MDFSQATFSLNLALPVAGFAPVEGEVHLWSGLLSRYFNRLEEWQSILSGDERIRADRFKIPLARERFCVGRGLLRQLLGRYSNCAASSLHFEFGPHGKPTLSGNSPIQFNVAHSDDVIVIAVAKRMQLGVDIERIDPAADVLSLAETVFAANEIDLLRQLNGPARQRAFYQIWTRKEAVLKAGGDGFVNSVADLSVISNSQEKPGLASHMSLDWKGLTWHVRDLDLRDGYCASIAIDQTVHTTKSWSIDELNMS